MRLITLATCNLNQWALDFEGNLARIVASIRQAKALGARYRLGPELEITGYGCEDHFLEADTLRHAWEVLAHLLEGDLTDDILCDVGLPVMHQGVRYNCRALLLNRRVLWLRPKMALADDGNYRESRWFTAWQQRRTLASHHLPRAIQALTGQQTVPFGDGALDLRDTVVSCEICEELFTPDSPHIYHYLDGVEIIGNGSSSHHELRKLHKRIDLMQTATGKSGGIYVYANQQGCDGGRLYFDGSAMIAGNGRFLAQGSQFSPKDVEVIVATVDLDEVRSFRGAFASRMIQASRTPVVPRIPVDFALSDPDSMATPTAPITVHTHTPEEEIAYGPACWLWDYLRRSGTGGFFLPLSGGADSSAVATLIGSMCQLVVREAQAGNQDVLTDIRRLLGQPAGSDHVPADPRHLAHHLLHTCYMATENSSAETRQRAKTLADEIGAYHLDLDMDTAVTALVAIFTRLTGQEPAYKVHGGSETENLALQNVQARLRMVLAYLLAQLLPWVRGRQTALLVLGTSNVDESLRGYVTKYDASSADINPIGSISKTDLRRFLAWAADRLGYATLHEVVGAPPHGRTGADYGRLPPDG